MSARAVAVVGAVAAVACAACEGVVPEIDWQQMIHQHKYLPYAACDLFSDGRAMRSPPVGTMPHDRRDDEGVSPPLSRALFATGRARFEITCAVCHGALADGRSEVAQHMDLRPPPSLLTDEVRAYPPDRIFAIASHGYGLMPGYERVLSPEERWAVVAWLRALQLSQSVRLADLPPETRATVEDALAKPEPAP